jgi:uncharacterized protein YecE (DUF72 family)
MDFGRIEPEEWKKIDFSLPADSPFNQRVLKGVKTTNLRVFVGCPIWANKEWLGKIYPSGTKEKDFLQRYTRQFNTIELNTTHYRIPDAETVERWKEAATPGFTYCPKIPQLISHERQLQSVEAITEEFCLSIAGLGDHLGVSFLQLPPFFGPKSLSALEKFVQFYPASIPLSVEFRHSDWFRDEKTWLRTLEMLQHYHISTVITDVAGRRDVLHQSLSTTTAVIRYVGNMEKPDDYTRIDAWVQRLKQWIGQGLEKVYFFVHEHDNIISPEVVRYTIRQLNQQLELKLAEPQFVRQAVQGSLF